NKNAQAKVSALTDNLNVSIVISPKVAITGNTVGYSVVNRNKEFDVPLQYSQFKFALSPAGPALGKAGEISAGAAAGTYSLSATLKDTAYAVTKDFQVKEPAYVPPLSPHNVSYEYSGDIPAAAPEIPTTAAFDTGSKVYLMPPSKLTGSTFSGWSVKSSGGKEVNIGGDGSFRMPDADVVFTGSFTRSVYTVSFYDFEGELIATKSALHGSDISTLPLIPSLSAITAPAVRYDYTHVAGSEESFDGYPCVINNGINYRFRDWEPDSLTKYNAKKGDHFSKDTDTFVGTFLGLTGDLNLYTSWVNLVVPGDSTPGLHEEKVFKIFYYASPSDLLYESSGNTFTKNKPIAVKTVSAEAIDTQILPSPGDDVTIGKYFGNLDSKNNSTYNNPVEWHMIDFGYSNSASGGYSIAPATPRMVSQNSLAPYKRLAYTMPNPDGAGLKVDKITTIGGFLSLQESYESWYLDNHEATIEDPLTHEVNPNEDYIVCENHTSANTTYSSINIFLSADAPYAAFNDNVPDEIWGRWPGEVPTVKGLPDRVMLLIDEDKLWSHGVQTVSIRLPDDVPAFEGSPSQDYKFIGWSATPTGGAISKPGEMIQFDVSMNNVNAGDRRLYAQWQKRTYSAYYYFQASDSDYFTSRTGLSWEDMAFPKDGKTLSIFDFLKELDDYIFTAKPTDNWAQVILGSDDEGDDMVINFGEYYGAETPSTIAEFLRTRKYDYVRFILDWNAVRPAGMDLTVASAYIEDVKSGGGDVIDDTDDTDDTDNKGGGFNPGKDDDKTNDSDKNTDNSKNNNDKNNGKDKSSIRDKNVKDNDKNKSNKVTDSVALREPSTPLAGAGDADTVPDAATIANPPDVPDNDAGNYDPAAGTDDEKTVTGIPVSNPGGGLTPLQIAVIAAIIAAGLVCGGVLIYRFRKRKLQS
ncbi:MAG: InlB B-repeat-containing protein, partial [Clostridiales Family XIII bacterium]|nr:InlB B-repeat-containing protein [Clostridiales Family XIII bacterium]